MWRGDRFSLAARNRGDSGSHSASAGTSTSGNTPPRMKITGQSKCASSNATIWPPTKPPMGAPVNVAMIIVARRRCGA